MKTVKKTYLFVDVLAPFSQVKVCEVTPVPEGVKAILSVKVRLEASPTVFLMYVVASASFVGSSLQ